MNLEQHVPLARSLARYASYRYRQDPDETLSDAFLGLVKAGRGADLTRPFAPYARKCVWGAILHGIRARVRASKRNQGLSLDDPSSHFADTRPDPREARELWRTVDQLPDREARAVQLHYRFGLSQDEIAPMLHVSQMQVSRDLRNARTRLAESL